MGTLRWLSLVHAETVAVAIAASAEGNYMYTTRSPTFVYDEDGSEIGSDRKDEVSRGFQMFDSVHVYINKLRVERADRKDKTKHKGISRMFLSRREPILVQENRDTKSVTIMKIVKLDNMD